MSLVKSKGQDATLRRAISTSSLSRRVVDVPVTSPLRPGDVRVRTRVA